MRTYCMKHKTPSGFVWKVLMIPYPNHTKDGILEFYCPQCDCYWYSRDCVTFYKTREEVVEA